MSDLIKRAEAHLIQCGNCDAGLPTNCACPSADPRAVIAELVDALKTQARVIAERQRRLAESGRIVSAAIAWAAAWDDFMTEGEDAGPAFTAAADALLATLRAGIEPY